MECASNNNNDDNDDSGELNWGELSQRHNWISAAGNGYRIWQADDRRYNVQVSDSGWRYH